MSAQSSDLGPPPPTDHAHGRPIGGLALELHEPDPAVREAPARLNLAMIGGGVAQARTARWTPSTPVSPA
jgi:hypothetical protein